MLLLCSPDFTKVKSQVAEGEKPLLLVYLGERKARQMTLISFFIMSAPVSGVERWSGYLRAYTGLLDNPVYPQ
jgi:hypothetical protein